MNDIRRQITERIIEAIEKGVPPWRKGWTTTGGLHYNESSGKPYRGINQILLSIAAAEATVAPQSDARWLTLKQANAKGLKVRKGAKAAQIVRMVEVEKSAPTKDGDDVLAEDKEKRLVMKLFHVFNGSQIEGLEPLPPRESKVRPVEAADAIVEGMKATGLTILHGGNTASYFEKLDTVRVPERAAFKSTEDYYSTLLHEISHSVGAEKRLKRLHRDARFGSVAYAREELVAEVCSAMACGEVGMELGPTHIANHASYLSSWLECLKADKNAIFVAAGAAERACEYMRGHALAVATKVDTEDFESQPIEHHVASSPKRRKGMRM
ncbi:MAG: zincin-like metallopeptidase domain-containing protein [Verrucomicrobiota bacterium]